MSFMTSVNFMTLDHFTIDNSFSFNLTLWLPNFLPLCELMKICFKITA